MAALPYRLMVVGTADDLERLAEPLQTTSSLFEVELAHTSDGELSPETLEKSAPDVAVIGPAVANPLPIARQLRTACPQAQIVFLLPPERIDRFRAGLPFVPHLASAWTASTASDALSVGTLLSDAALASRERIATATVVGRINQQLAARKTAPAQIRRSQLALSESYLAAILTQSPDAFLAVALDGAVIAHNDAAARLFEPALNSADPARAASLFEPEDGESIANLLSRAAQGESLTNIGIRLDRRDNPHFELSLAPIQDETGRISTISITARDVTERKIAEERQRLLINELNHRVKNTLAIVQALAQQSFKGNAPPAQERAAFEARLQTLSNAHNLLTRQHWESTSLAEVIEASIEGACGGDTARQHVEGPQVSLGPQTAVAVAMAMHELCTNAIKYGALSRDAGNVRIVWRIRGRDGETRLRLEWAEHGGPPVVPATKRGFGTRMIERGLGAELGAEVRLDFRREGLVCTIDAPLAGLRS